MHMTKTLIVSMAALLAIWGSASVASAEPPDHLIENSDIFEAFLFETSVGDPCRMLDIEFQVADVTLHAGSFMNHLQSGHVSLSAYDYESGTWFLLEQSGFVPDIFSVNMNSATVSAEVQANRYQCDADPTCSDGFMNCVLVGQEPVLIDLTWTGIGAIEVFHSTSTVPSEDSVFISNEQTMVRDATVTGVVSVGDFDFEIEDENGELVNESQTFGGIDFPG